MQTILHMVAIAVTALFSAPSPATPELRPIDAPGLSRIVGQSAGKVVVVNMWATWCLPCVEEFPAIMEMRRNMSEDVEVIFVSLDDPKKAGSVVRPFLKRMEVDFTTYIKRAGDDELFINAVSPEWSGALPATFIYDTRGALAEMRVEQLTREELEATIMPLLGK